MYLPVFLCLYESFWKGFESDQRRLTLLISNGCLSGASYKIGREVTSQVSSTKGELIVNLRRNCLVRRSRKQTFDTGNVNRL